MVLTLIENEEVDSEVNELIKYIKEIPSSKNSCYAIFDKKDVTLKTTYSEIIINMIEFKYCSKVDVRINRDALPKEVYKMLNLIPTHLVCRLEINNLEHMIKLLKNKNLFWKLKKRNIKIMHKDIEIVPKKINTQQDENDLKIKIEEELNRKNKK